MWLWLMKIPTQYLLIMPIRHSNAMWQFTDTTWWQTFEPSNASDATSRPNVESICKMLLQTKYKSDFKKYRKSEGEIQEYLNWDLAARESRPCGQVSCFWFLPEEAGRVYAHPLLQVQVQYMITISSLYPKTTSFITRLGFWAGALCSHQGGHVLNLHHPRHHGSDPTQRSHSIPISIPF